MGRLRAMAMAGLGLVLGAAEFQIDNLSRAPWILQEVEYAHSRQGTWLEPVMERRLPPGQSLRLWVDDGWPVTYRLVDDRGWTQCLIVLQDLRDPERLAWSGMRVLLLPGAEVSAGTVLRQVPEGRLVIRGERWLWGPMLAANAAELTPPGRPR